MKEEIFNLLGYATKQDLIDIKKEVDRLLKLAAERDILLKKLGRN